jgi:glycosyltransferase involved in cell wall biosynthesis
LRILALNYEYPPLGGGGGVAAQNIAEGLVRVGHEVDYVTSHCHGLARQETVRGVGIFREPVIGRKDRQTASIVSMLSFPMAAIGRAVALRRFHDYDVIHTHFAIPTGPAGYVLSTCWRKPNVLSVYGGDIYDPSKKYSPHRQPLLRMAVRRVLNQASAVVAESEDLIARTVATYGPKQPPFRIPLGFKAPQFGNVSRAAMGLDADKVYAVAVSRLISRKGYPDLLAAFARCQARDLRLLIVGDGPEAPALKRMCAELGVGERVRFLGQVGEELKYQYLSSADLFVLATQHEGYGIVYQEAMHCGLPIVTTNVGGQTDFLADGKNALLCCPGDVEGLAARIDLLATDAAARKEMGARNREAVKEHGIEGIVRQYIVLFEEAIARCEPGVHGRPLHG